MNSYFNIVKKLFKRHSKLYTLKHDALCNVVLSKISYFITPLFIFLKFSPNFITLINFFVALASIFLIISLDGKLFIWGILLYFLYRILDFSDGSVARYYNISSFYGRFIDSFLDIFYFSFLILSISFYTFKVFENENLFILGIVSTLFAVFDTYVYDKYSSLARWLNQENKKKVIPYLRKKFLSRITFMYVDIYFLCFLTLLFTAENKFYFEKVVLLLFITFIIAAVQNLMLHFINAYKSFNNKAKDKEFYTKK